MDGRDGGGMNIDSNVNMGDPGDAMHQKVQYVCGCKLIMFKFYM